MHSKLKSRFDSDEMTKFLYFIYFFFFLFLVKDDNKS